MSNRLLDTVNQPSDIKNFTLAQLVQLSSEIRQEIIEVVSATGGHLASSLGAIELCVALHYVFSMPNDKIVWDVGHQTYAHKLLTGRREKFKTLRKFKGISGFPSKFESEYDLFTVGHGSTAISCALGLNVASFINCNRVKVIAVVGDGSLQGGMALEALSHAGDIKRDLIVVLNDNEMSISPTVGAYSKYLNRIITNPVYNRIREDIEALLKKMPKFGLTAVKIARKLEEGLKNLLVPGILFEELGFRYFGPIDGHNLEDLINIFKNIKNIGEPVLIHIITKKGKGYRFAEEQPSLFHSAKPFYIASGRHKEKKKSGCKISYTQAFAQTLIEIAGFDEKILAITAAMPEGCGLVEFAKRFPERFFNVGMAEQHAVTFAAGLAKGGFKPVIAIYSTFLQRAYDQIVHDVALQDLDVIFAIDRAGIVGGDGPTHQGVFDISYLRHIPNLTILAASNCNELKYMLKFAANFKHPVAIRYPKTEGLISDKIIDIKLGKAEIIHRGKTPVAIIALGEMVNISIEALELLQKEDIDPWVINARFIKPLDKELILSILTSVKTIVTVEEGVISGGFGSAISEFLHDEQIEDIKNPIRKNISNGVNLIRMGIGDKFIEQGARNFLLDKCGLSPKHIASEVIACCKADYLV